MPSTSFLELAGTAATLNFGQHLATCLPPGAVLLLAGDLGTGKTTLVQGLALGLGISEPVVSPTFTLINEYPEGRIPLYHLDLYRLSPGEVAELYLENYWEGREAELGIMAIEWPERLPYLPDRYLQINLHHSGPENRRGEILLVGDWPGVSVADLLAQQTL